MTVDFVDYFWGEKNNGFDVLYHNMKYGQLSSKELSEFIQERSNMEEMNWKHFGKMAKQTASFCGLGTFAPLWLILRTSVEKLSNLHFQMFQKMTELVKEVAKYTEDLHKKHRVVKDEEASTLEVVRMMHTTTQALQKAKDAYGQRNFELDKLKKDNASPKDIEKAEAKLKKAQEDYRNLVEKYSLTKEEFEKRMTVSCKHFQEVEEAHLRQMKEFLTAYAEALETNHDQIGKVHMEFKRRCVEMTVDKLLEQFVLNKYTGLEKPGMIDLEDAPPIAASPDSVENKDGKTARESYPLTIGFLRSRREKRKAKNAAIKKKKENSIDSTSNKEDKSDGEEVKEATLVEPETRDVDEDGYSVKPQLPDWPSEKRSFYSSSDSDSDDERDRRIKVEIKPLAVAPLSASVDELRATVENLALSPVGATLRRGSDDRMKRSQSVSQQLGGGKPVGDLAALNLFQSPTVSSASTPTGVTPYAPLNSPPPTARDAEIDAFNENPRPAIALPRPPSRRSGGRASPIVSMSPVEFRTAGVGTGSSRGPSPLTIGMTDTIPLAVAFHEIIHCYFRGSDETRCQVKISGDLMISFPAGIVAVLAHHPSPAPLRFRIRDTRRMENIVPNKMLVIADSGQSATDCHVYEFNMPALTGLLRKQAEQNPSASYFNVDILKYAVKPKNGAGSCPFQLVAYWKCGVSHTDLKIDYKYNSHAMAAPSPLLNLTVAAPVDGSVRGCQSKPTAVWNEETGRAHWQFTELSQHSDGHGVGSLRARFDLATGPGTQGTIAAQFNCEGTTLSGAELELVGSGYRLSLVKRRFVSGKYICDGDTDAKYRYASPSSTEC